MAGTSIGKFQVLGTLGTGANSTILHVRRSVDSRNYALKVIPINNREDWKYHEQAQHEFRVAQMLDHPCVLRIFTLEIERDWLMRPRKTHLLTEYVNGRTLDSLKCPPLAGLVLVFARVAAGLAHMHERNVFHADLKPNNIMLSRAGEVKIIDFGLAWIRGECKNRVQGTPEYMAPEQASRRLVTAHTDIYNFGATMYRLTTSRLPPTPIKGDLPLDARSFRQLLTPVQEVNREAPGELCDLIHRCLAFNPQDRPERMSEVKGVLDGLNEKLNDSSADLLEEIEW